MNRAELSNKNNTAILRALAAVKQCVVAEQLGIDESQVSRWKSSGEIAKTADFLAVLGLRLVDVESLTVSKARLQSVMTLAAMVGEMTPEEFAGK
jgi:hypothetical protein